jgi:hypothetical protein
MLLGGLWHGAGWKFVAWGGLHGFYLIVNHGWERAKTNLGFRNSTGRLKTLSCGAVARTFRAAARSGGAVLDHHSLSEAKGGNAYARLLRNLR